MIIINNKYSHHNNNKNKINENNLIKLHYNLKMNFFLINQ